MAIEDIKTVGVCGAGSMGAGITQIAAQAGFQVKVVDVSEAVWGRAEKTIAKSLERMLKKEVITEAQMQETIARISFSTDVASLTGVPFIFEAVFENIDVKRELFGKLDAIVGDDVVYATNTSSLAITEMAAMVKRPAKFVGMHFFNPVPMMK
ncbi:MAG: 3-hydroxyacyl-CoA dehydrogenase NAD-binding domain-containing protein, partial [Deltaproteobacteria bacterium]